MGFRFIVSFICRVWPTNDPEFDQPATALRALCRPIVRAGFGEIEELVFGERSQILVDPGEEKLKNEFSGVKRSYIPLQSIVRIDEVEKEGAARISEGSSAKIAPFPVMPQGATPSSADD